MTIPMWKIRAFLSICCQRNSNNGGSSIQRQRADMACGNACIVHFKHRATEEEEERAAYADVMVHTAKDYHSSQLASCNRITRGNFTMSFACTPIPF